MGFFLGRLLNRKEHWSMPGSRSRSTLESCSPIQCMLSVPATECVPPDPLLIELDLSTGCEIHPFSLYLPNLAPL